MYVCMYVCVFLCMCVNIYIYIYIYRYTHMHTYTRHLGVLLDDAQAVLVLLPRGLDGRQEPRCYV